MPGPNYFDGSLNRKRGPDYFGGPKRRRSADWRKHEADVARRTGGKVTRSSGAVKPVGQSPRYGGKIRARGAHPGDVVGHRVRECKATSTDRLSIQTKWLPKIINEALTKARRAVVEFRWEQAAEPTPTDWCFLPAQDYEALVEGVSADEHACVPERVETPYKSMGITINRLDELVGHAPEGHVPALVIEFTCLRKRAGAPTEWILLPAESYDALEELAS